MVLKETAMSARARMALWSLCCASMVGFAALLLATLRSLGEPD
jgi:hypothetical protein